MLFRGCWEPARRLVLSVWGQKLKCPIILSSGTVNHFYFWIYNLSNSSCLLSKFFSSKSPLCYLYSSLRPQGRPLCPCTFKSPHHHHHSRLCCCHDSYLSKMIKPKHLERNIIFRNDCTCYFPVLVQILDFFPFPLLGDFADIHFTQGLCHQVVKNRWYKHKSP